MGINPPRGNVSVLGINPPQGINPPTGINPPRGVNLRTTSQSLVTDYQDCVGVGVFLRALDALNYTGHIKASRRGDKKTIDAKLKKHEAEVEQLKRLGSRQRMLLASAPMLAAIRADYPGKHFRLTIDGKHHAVAYPQAQAKAAVKRVADELRLGEVNLDFIAVEAENPTWPFVHALRMHDSPIERYAYTGEVMDVVADVHAPPIYVLKHLMGVKRPHEVDTTIRPWVPSPAHASFPSGHGTYAHAMAVVLHALTGASDATALPNLAAAVAKRRELAGVHTHLDSAMGAKLGAGIGAYMIAQATEGTNPEFAPWRTLFAMASREWV